MLRIALPSLPLATSLAGADAGDQSAWGDGWLALVRLADVPAGDSWLAPAERERQGRLGPARSRAAWRAGRWAAKQALADRLRLAAGELARLAVLPDPQGAPGVLLDGETVDLRVSISHRAGAAIAAVVGPPLRIGCDLERIEARCEAFVADYFTAGEQALFTAAADAARPLLANLLWSAKESALKLLRCGLGEDRRSVEVRLAGPLPRTSDHVWHPLDLEVLASHEHLWGFWTRDGARVLTLAVAT